MIRLDVLLLLLGMSLATYIPRLLPAVLVDKLRLSPSVEKFLRLIPYTAMATLVFPGILTVDAERPWIGIVGGAVAALLARFKCPMMVCVLAAIGVDLCIYLVI